MIDRSKLNSIESKMSESLINNEISHEDFMKIINEEKKYQELKESIRMMNSQRSDTDLLVVLVDQLLKTKKKFKNLRKQEVQNIFTEMN